MNPRYGHWPDGCPAESVAPARMRAARVLRERWVTDWRESRLLARGLEHAPPPRDQSQWLAWALGKPTTGPRWVREEVASLVERVQARGTRAVASEPAAGPPRGFLTRNLTCTPRPKGAPPAPPPAPTKGRIARVTVGPTWRGDPAPGPLPRIDVEQFKFTPMLGKSDMDLLLLHIEQLHPHGC